MYLEPQKKKELSISRACLGTAFSAELAPSVHIAGNVKFGKIVIEV